MKNRLNKIITKTGDQGITSLSDGNKTSKNDPIIHVLGELDELNCSIGVLKATLKEHYKLEKKYSRFVDILADVQHDLFNIGGEISAPNIELFDTDRISFLTELSKNLNKELDPLKEFIIPGNSFIGSLAHSTRAICRRVERNFINMIEKNIIMRDRQLKRGLPYLNRLSDLFFIISRHLDKTGDEKIQLWNKPEKNKIFKT